MYVPDHFAMTAEESRALLAQVAAADLVTSHDSGLVATFLPFVFDPGPAPHGALLTHVARNNSQAIDPVRGEALVIVHGADHYVSPRWLPSLAQTGRVVPTWNYLTVHAYGQLVVHDDATWTEGVVRRMTAAHEPEHSVDDLPADYVTRMLRAVIGLEVRITRIEAKAKMSQNRAPADVAGIVEGLRAAAGGDAASAAAVTADWMQEHSLPAARRRADLLADLAATRGRRDPRRTAGG